MDRATVEIKLPKTGKKVVLNEYLTAAEERTIKNSFLGDVTFKYKGKEAESSDVQATRGDVQEDKTLELMVVSVDGSKENILPTLHNLPSKDFRFLKAKIEELTGDDDEEDTKKK